MNFQQTADSAVTFGRSLLPRSRGVAGALTGGILIGALFATTAGAGSNDVDRHLVKAPAPSKAAKPGMAAKGGKTSSAVAEGGSKSDTPVKPTPKPAMVGAVRSLANARSGDWSLCRKAAAAIEARTSTPKHLLSAVTLTETGRRGPHGKSLQAWPWTINAGGKGYVFRTKDDALRAVRRLLAQGQRSIDVGCMQVNLKYHPRAFTSLEEAFDPLANLAYGAEFLARLKMRHGTWGLAVQHYHSYTVEYRESYAVRFNKLWALERRRMAAAKKAAKTASAGERGVANLAHLQDIPRTLMQTAMAKFEPLPDLSPLASLVAVGVNVDALRKTAEDGSRYLQQLAGNDPAIPDTRMQSASLAGPLTVN